jgi:hypothetical protein
LRIRLTWPLFSRQALQPWSSARERAPCWIWRRAIGAAVASTETPHGATEPLVRYEFLETPHGIPAAHVQVHGDHPTWMGVFESISGTRRARKHRRRQRVSDLHFPVGGRRFRPCLEDVLEMLILEFNVVPSPDQETARVALRAGRAAWRAHQLGAAVADNPAVAVRVLTQLGYEVTWRGQRSEPEARVDRLREL